MMELRKEYLRLLRRIIFIAALCYLMLSQVFLVTQARGNGMFPAVKDGDLIIAFRLQTDYAAEDVVVYSIDGQNQIGRIVAQGGDVVMMDDSGTLWVNDIEKNGRILYPSYAGEGLTYPYTVAPDHVFLLGDYRTQARDSRIYGAISMEDVKAKVITILRRQGI